MLFFNKKDTPENAHLRPPSLPLLALELRAPWEFGAVLPTWPVLQRAPLGDGHTVVVFPGLTAGDTTTVPLRRYLDSRNYDAQGWGQGLNLGPREGVLDNAKRQLQTAADASGRKVSLVGWSLGGVYARELAKELPDLVRCVITLGTPFSGHHRSTNAWRIYQLASGRDVERETENYNLPEAPPVPTSKILPMYDHWKSIEDVNAMRRNAISHFFEHYKDLEKGKWVKVVGWEGIDGAKKEVADGIESYQKANA